MIKVGEETGQLDAMLLKVATTYEKESERFGEAVHGSSRAGDHPYHGLVIAFIVVSMLVAIFGILELPF